jgi:hypothetical protein
MSSIIGSVVMSHLVMNSIILLGSGTAHSTEILLVEASQCASAYLPVTSCSAESRIVHANLVSGGHTVMKCSISTCEGLLAVNQLR